MTSLRDSLLTTNCPKDIVRLKPKLTLMVLLDVLGEALGGTHGYREGELHVVCHSACYGKD